MLSEYASMKCEICQNEAKSRNYGAFTCNACKMFFRRIKLFNQKERTCDLNGDCFDLKPPRKCRGCRYEKCLKSGMFIPDIELKNKKDDWVGELIKGLHYQNGFREKSYHGKFLFGDFNLEHIVRNLNSLELEPKEPSQKLRYIDWVFMKCFTGIKFLLNLEFVRDFPVEDKMILMKGFHLKATLMFFALESKNLRLEGPRTPEGEHTFPDEVAHIPGFTEKRLNKMRCQPMGRFQNLNITETEFLLVMVILFLNPVLSKLSANTVEILSAQREHYNSALFQHLQLTHQQDAPARLADLLSISHVMNENFKELEFLIVMFRACMPNYHVQKIVCNED